MMGGRAPTRSRLYIKPGSSDVHSHLGPDSNVFSLSLFSRAPTSLIQCRISYAAYVMSQQRDFTSEPLLAKAASPSLVALATISQ